MVITNWKFTVVHKRRGVGSVTQMWVEYDNVRGWQKFRRMPKKFWQFYKLSQKMQLTHPEGRALYACNRMQNGWPRSRKGIGFKSYREFLRGVRASTCIRWWRHWQNGGSIRMISLTNRAWLDRHYKLREEHKVRMAEFHREMKENPVAGREEN